MRFFTTYKSLLTILARHIALIIVFLFFSFLASFREISHRVDCTHIILVFFFGLAEARFTWDSLYFSILMLPFMM